MEGKKKEHKEKGRKCHKLIKKYRVNSKNNWLYTGCIIEIHVNQVLHHFHILLHPSQGAILSCEGDEGARVGV